MFRKTAALAAGLVLLLVGAGAVQAAGANTYVVQPGDTLYSLAKRLGSTVAQLVSVNGIGADYLIRVGQTLVIPAGATTGATTEPTKGLAAEPTTGRATGQAAPATGQASAAVATTQPTQPSHAGQPGPTGKNYATVKPVAELKRELLVDRGAVLARPPLAAITPAAPAPTPTPVEGRPVEPPAAQATPPVEGAGTRPAETAPAYVIPVTSEERLLLARLVVAEAGEEPLAGQVGVAAVVVNRVKRPGFPKSVTAVIQEPGQFKTIELGRVDKAVADADALAAVDRALAGEDPTNGAIFFYNPQRSVALDFWKTRPVTAVIGGHNFAK